MPHVSASVPFVKANGCGNDFLIIEVSRSPKDAAAFTRAICDRHTGVGADGVEWVEGGTGDFDVSARLINADGSEAEISGNGTRCVAAYWASEHGAKTVRVRTGAGVKSCRLMSEKGGRAFQFEMNMGTPMMQGSLELNLRSGRVAGIRVSLGNPHFVIFVPEFAANWQELGTEIQSQKVFTKGTNVDFVRIAGAHEIESRFFERGVGETRSSGTGSCASAVAANADGRVKSPVTVSAPGGAQEVRWDGGSSEIFLTGPAELVCKGEFFI